MNNYERKLNKERSIERHNLIDVETDVKEALMQLKDALWHMKSISADDKTWELTHHMYSAVEHCDRALSIVFQKENAGTFYYDPFSKEVRMVNIDDE